MKFSEWYLKEVRNKGFMRQFNNEYPNMPAYVSHQMYNNFVSPRFDASVKAYHSGPTIASSGDPKATIPYTQISQGISSAGDSDTLKHLGMQNVIWSKKPEWIVVNPLSFDARTRFLFMKWKFGLQPHDSLVRHDSARFAKQRSLIQKDPEAENEPIVVIKDGEYYQLVDGFHRMMPRLLAMGFNHIGAPPDQIAALSNDLLDKIDFNIWKPVKVKAYVGVYNPNSPR